VPALLKPVRKTGDRVDNKEPLGDSGFALIPSFAIEIAR